MSEPSPKRFWLRAIAVLAGVVAAFALVLLMQHATVAIDPTRQLTVDVAGMLLVAIAALKILVSIRNWIRRRQPQ